MLAERKQKTKWNPNPCGNLWAKDSNKFGQKILEKFGWTPGKGLGAKGQGIVAPVKLKCNSTQKGFGYERGKKLEWLQHQEEFSSILSELNTSEGNSDAKQEELVSLEEKSKNCKTRVHYHKYTRGKDLSRYSEKDLSCILGAFSNQTVNNSSPSYKSNSDEGWIGFTPTSFPCENQNSRLTGEGTQHSREQQSNEEIIKSKKKRKRKQVDLDEVVAVDKSISLYELEETNEHCTESVLTNGLDYEDQPARKTKKHKRKK